MLACRRARRDLAASFDALRAAQFSRPRDENRHIAIGGAFLYRRRSRGAVAIAPDQAGLSVEAYDHGAEPLESR
jgi:hypothetical protein